MLHLEIHILESNRAAVALNLHPEKGHHIVADIGKLNSGASQDASQSITMTILFVRNNEFSCSRFFCRDQPRLHRFVCKITPLGDLTNMQPYVPRVIQCRYRVDIDALSLMTRPGSRMIRRKGARKIGIFTFTFTGKRNGVTLRHHQIHRHLFDVNFGHFALIVG